MPHRTGRIAGSAEVGDVAAMDAPKPLRQKAIERLPDRVVGRAADADYGHVATVWDLDLNSDGSFDVIGSSSLAPSYHKSEALAITEAGDITGILADGSTPTYPVDWEDTAFVIRDGSLELLSSGGRNQYGIGHDLNDTDVVGTISLYALPGSFLMATRWNSKNRPENLSEEYFGDAWKHAEAQGLNSQGNIVGTGIGMDGSSHGWLLTKPVTALSSAAIPEPTTAALLVAATVPLEIWRRRRRGPRPLQGTA